MNGKPEDVLWGQVLPEVVKVIVVSAITLICVRVYDWWKRIRVFADRVELKWYTISGHYNEEVQTDKPDEAITAQWHFVVRFFSRKSQAIGLHRIAVEFTKGRPWFRRQVLIRDERPVSRYIPTQSSWNIDYLEEILIKPAEWSTENVRGKVTGEQLAALKDSDSMWLAAETDAGKKKRWLVARLPVT